MVAVAMAMAMRDETKKPLAPFHESPAPENPILEEAAAAAVRTKEHKRKKQQVAAPSPAQNPILQEEAVPARKKKEPPAQSPASETPVLEEAAAQNPISEEETVMAIKKKKKMMLSFPSPSAAADTPILETKNRKRSKEQEPSGQSLLPSGPGHTHCVHLHRTTAPPEQQADAPNGKSMKKSNCKKPRVLSNREIIKMRIEHLRMHQTLPQGFFPAMSLNSDSNCTEQNPNYSSPLGAFFDQFRYKPVRQDRNPILPRIPDHPPQGYPSFESSQLTANETSNASKANTSVGSKTKQQRSGSGSQAKVNVKEKKNPEKKEEEQVMSSPSPSAAAETPILEQEAKVTNKQKRRKEQEPSGPGHTHCVHLQGTTPPPEQQAGAPNGKSMKKSNCKKPSVPSNHEIIKMRIEHLRMHQTMPQGFSPAMSLNSDSNCTEQNPNYSSPLGAFFDQFSYKPVRQVHNPLLPRTPDRLARLPPRGYPSFEPSQLTANETSKASKANTSVVSKTKQQRSASGSQAKVNVKEKKNPEKKMRTKKQRKPKPLLTSAEKRSDKYRRVPLDQLVPPPRSPHMLLQEEYASDPWKVIVICMLLNLTQGKQVRKIVDGFFRLYPDAQTAFNADPVKMEGYLAPLGLQRVKTIRIQKFSREYVEKEWTYVTELCGVGKYAADAYAIFCAGRAIEVVPEDHKLVDYWKYVCSAAHDADLERAANACSL